MSFYRRRRRRYPLTTYTLTKTLDLPSPFSDHIIETALNIAQQAHRRHIARLLIQEAQREEETTKKIDAKFGEAKLRFYKFWRDATRLLNLLEEKTWQNRLIDTLILKEIVEENKQPHTENTQ